MISVIIPTYKQPEALDLCLKSAIFGQQDKNQIIVVVDGTYDDNKSVLDKYKDFIDVLPLSENCGLCYATNIGVYNAKSDKILIVNDDNVFPKFWDVKLESLDLTDTVISPNQIEPYPSMFADFIIKDLGRTVKDFNLSDFIEYEQSVSVDKLDNHGSTLPIFMKKLDYLKLGGWDERYSMGMVADWDFFLKCTLSGLEMKRTYNCNFYHFVSLSTKTPDQENNRRIAELEGHEYAKYKWGNYIQHNTISNLKSI